jgi:hypothetical protein
LIDAKRAERAHHRLRGSIARCATPRPRKARGAGCSDARPWAPPESPVASAVIPAGAALASAHDDSKPHDSIDEWGVFASTTEALTVTILTELLRRASLNSVPSSVSVIFDGVYAAELDHWNFIHEHFRPSTCGSGFRTASSAAQAMPSI